MSKRNGTRSPVRSIPVMLDKERHLRFTLNAIIAIGERVSELRGQEVTLEKILEGGTVPLKEFKILLWAALKHEDPGLTEDQVGDIVDVENLPRIQSAMEQAFKEQKPKGSGASRPPLRQAG